MTFNSVEAILKDAAPALPRNCAAENADLFWATGGFFPCLKVSYKKSEKSGLKKCKIAIFFAVLPFFRLKEPHFGENRPFNLF